MIKQILHKVSSFILALVVLFSTFSFTVEKHYCGDMLIDASIFSEVEKCAMEAVGENSEKLTKKPCCKDEVDIVEGQDELKTDSFNGLSSGNQLFLKAYTYSYNNLFLVLTDKVVSYELYSPPKLIKDIQVFDQVFVI